MKERAKGLAIITGAPSGMGEGVARRMLATVCRRVNFCWPRKVRSLPIAARKARVRDKFG